MVVERYYSCDLKVLLALVVDYRDMRSALLPVEEVYPKCVDLLDDDHRERPPVDQGPDLGKIGGALSVGVGY